MIQADLLADLPRARNSDPATSHAAADRVKTSGALGRQQQLVLSYVRQHPGHTSAELARLMAQARDDDGGRWAGYRPMLGRRLPELEPVHLRKGAERTCDVTGYQCITWWPR